MASNPPVFSKPVQIDHGCLGRGVYRLLDDTSGSPVVVYVGQAKNVPTRVMAHLAEGTKFFTAFDYVLAPYATDAELTAIESEEIFRSKPRHNRGLRETAQLLTFAGLCLRLGISRPEMREALLKAQMDDYLGFFALDAVVQLFPGREFPQWPPNRDKELREAKAKLALLKVKDAA